MFSDLSARHSGDYTCRVSNHAATVNYTATLSVKVAPTWMKEPLDTAVLLGAPLNVECAAKGYPPPTVTWYRKIGEGMSLSPESSEQWQLLENMIWDDKSRSGTHTVRAQNGTLSAPATARNHQGIYRCSSDNGVGPPLVKHINLTVHEPAHFEGSGGNVSSVRGQSASLACHALGDAPLTVHWTHMGVRLDLNSYRWTVSEVRTVDGLRSVLQLRAAERADAGEYRCHAHNQFGRSEVLMYLHIEEPPEAPKAIRLGGVGSRWVRLVWRSTPRAGVYFTATFTALLALPGANSEHTTANLTLDSSNDDRFMELQS
ncbi:unnamed protein product [Diatraea saccharalis]|uniref:Ig-like domain-containing protein n=1 Tax=Diatraea saccharalis TaxID=40085 RepID=A0A9N9RGB7_9NEOP|nr:unnamed protein product [Diatraea saccharalis]